MKILEFTPTVPHLFPKTLAALRRPLFSHRSDEFGRLFLRTSELLKSMSRNRFHPLIAAGTGTWANELMAWNILPNARRAIVVANGEFGSRLYRQCRACRPDTALVEMDWGAPFDRDKIASALEAAPEIDWIFAVATETSCGISNDLDMLDRLCRPRGIRLALDGVSAVGMTGELFRLTRAGMITGSSGKALAGLPGIALIFRDTDLELKPVSHIPDSMDIAKLIAAESSPGMVRNTLGSLQLSCLAAGLEELAALPDYRGMHAGYKQQIINAFGQIGIEALPDSNSPLVTTFRRPPAPEWQRLDSRLSTNGISLYTDPEYLKSRGLFQVATMGNITPADIQRLTDAITS